MSLDTYTLEPFPKFVDTVDSSKVGYFSRMGALHMLSPSGAVQLRHKQDAIARDLFNYITLHYYQYEVTMGLYVMTLREKLICNTVILGICTAVMYGMYYGLQPFLVKSICQVIYYLSGSISGIEDLCPDTSCL